MKLASCLDCNLNTLDSDFYMTSFELWAQINPGREGYLCLSCAENRLGRALRAGDFLMCPLNADLVTVAQAIQLGVLKLTDTSFNPELLDRVLNGLTDEMNQAYTRELELAEKAIAESEDEVESF